MVNNFNGRENRQQDTDEKRIFAQSFGGLNVVANPLNIPYEDSPLLVNTVVDISGNVEKRKGTRVIYNSTETVNSTSVFPFSSALSYNFLLMKVNTSLRIFEVFSDSATQVMQKLNVWDSSASNSRLSVCQTSEREPRVIMCTGTNKPVQLKFVEQQTTQPATGTTVGFSNALRFANANTSNSLVYVDRQRVSVSSMSISGSTLTVTTTTPVPANAIVDIVLITWQWFAEALTYNGDAFFATRNRFNAVPTDQVVKVPDSLVDDIDPKDVISGSYKMYPSASSSRLSIGYTANDQPSTNTTYSFSDGARYVYSATNFPVKSPYFVTFGALEAANTSSTAYFVRKRALAFNNRTGAMSANVDVFVDGVKVSQVVTLGSGADLVYKNYTLCDSNGAIIPSAGLTTTRALYVSFEAQQMGLPANSIVEVVNKELKHIGSAATQTAFNYTDGSYVAAYGLGFIANYSDGYYPSAVSLYQSRLVFSGFLNRPLTVVFSCINDTVVPNSFYSSFQIDENNIDETSPFDVTFTSTSNDRVITVIEWQASLFVLTRYAVFRLHGGNAPLSPTSRYVAFVSNTGVVNSRCVTQTDFNVMYLSDTGLYDLTPIIENGEYQVRERSLKIRPKFGITKDPTYEELPWIDYDSESRLVYIGYCIAGESKTTRHILAYNTLRDSWTEFNTPGGFNSFSATNYVDRATGNAFLLACTTERAGNVSNNIILLKLNDKRYIDFRQTATASGAALYIPPTPEITLTVNSQQRRYGVSYQLTRQTKAFQMNPISEVRDVLVSANGVPLTQGVDFVKEQGAYIYLTKDLPTGTVLTVRLASPNVGLVSNVGHVIAYANNVLTESYTVNNNSISFTEPNGTNLEWGQVYLTIYTTPMFSNQSLATYKRMKHLYVYFDNTEGLRTYASNELAPGQDPQQLVDTYTTRINCNLSVMYNSELSGETTTDVYGFDEVYWDDSLFDIAPSASQNTVYSLFKETLQGVGYSYQFAIWNQDDSTFKLCGYQVDLHTKGKRYTGRA